jgi:hypothetical protein
VQRAALSNYLSTTNIPQKEHIMPSAANLEKALRLAQAQVPQRSLPVDKLYVEPEYGMQRPPPTDKWLEAHSGKHFIPAAVRPLEVAEDGKGGYAILDGQGRHLLAQRHGIKQLPCRIHSGLTAAERAGFFLTLNDARKVSAVDMFRVRVGAEDPKALRIYSTLKDNGFIVGGKGKEGITGIATIEHVVDDKQLGLDALDVAARVARAAWPADRKPAPKPTGIEIAAIAMLHAIADPRLDEGGAIKVLGKYAPSQLRLKAVEMNSGRTPRTDQMPRMLTHIIAGIYNRGRQRNKADLGYLPDLAGEHFS